MLTQEEYLQSKMTLFDEICWYSWIPTILCIFVLMGFAAVSGTAPSGFIILFLVLFANTIALRAILGIRIKNRKIDYFHGKP